jgi:hypothetical protein
MAKVVRTVRFEKIEIEKIEAFLRKNSFLDFSSLARLAISRFVEHPNIQIRPLVEREKRSQKGMET